MSSDRDRIAELERELAAARETIEALKDSSRRHDAVALDQIAVQKAMSSLQDIIASRTNELRASEARYRALFDYNPNLAFTVDGEGMIVDANCTSEELFGSAETLDGRPLNALFASQARPVVDELLFNEGGEASHLVLDQGGIVDLAVARVPGHALYLVLGRDVTREREMESKVREDQKLKAIGHLAGGIAHDFNNLLGGICGYAELLQVDPDPAIRDEATAGILETSRRAADLVAGLLAFARRGAYEARVVDLHALIEQVVKIASRTFDRRVHIGTQLDADPSTVRGDAAQLQAAILNLALNARDAMPEGGRIKISTRTVTFASMADEVDPSSMVGEVDPDVEPVDAVESEHVEVSEGSGARHLAPWIELTVQDEGVGIAPEHRSHVFEPFFTTKAGGKGTGLGLSIVYGTVRAHGGTIDLETEEGFGTSFKIRLQSVAADEESTASEVPLPGHGASRRILVVDDEPTVRSTMTRFLQHVGYEVVAVPGGGEALNYFGADGGGFDLVVLDLVMPDVHGSEILVRMRERAPQIPIIVVTGYSMLSPEATQELGADVLLRKPFPIGELAGRIGEVLADRSSAGPT